MIIICLVEEEEEEEEEEDSVANIRHPRFIYKVRSVQAPDHPTTSFHTIVPNASSLSPISSYMMKMDEKSIQKPNSNKYFNDESSLSRNPDHLPSSVITNTEQNPVPTITFNEGEQFPSFETHPGALNYLKEHHPEQMINSTDQIQELNSSYKGQFSGVPISIGLSFDNTDYTFNHEFDTSFPLPMNFETNKTDIPHYDEILLQDYNISRIQHAPLFGCTAENLYTFATSGFDLLGTNDPDNVNMTITDDHNSRQQIIIGLTQDGQVIIDGLTMPISKKLKNDQENASRMFCTSKTDEETVSLTMYQIPENLNEHLLNVKHLTGNEVVSGLNARGEFIIANTIDNSSWKSKHLMSVIMGLAASGQIIYGGCISDSKCVFTTSEKTIESNDHQAIVDIVANLTANNEKVVVGLTDSNFTSFNESLLRSDSF
ncbi:unnamed protein product [Onchocerca flexuosa]|uniref:Uncharacterized protein n=2 Tax=Onchocerca flexuosa TaxID=387005 RepID=A0A3P7VBC7_9BILA|nr:unnamed protein product [Onchocerca flexuosa]